MNLFRKGLAVLILSVITFILGIVVNVSKVPEAFTNAIGSISDSYLNGLKSPPITLNQLYLAYQSYTGYLSQATNFAYLAFAIYVLGVILVIIGVYWIYQNIRES